VNVVLCEILDLPRGTTTYTKTQSRQAQDT